MVLFPDLGVLSTQDLVVEITVVLSGNGVGIGLSIDLDTLVIGEADEGVAVEGHKYRAGKAAVVVAAIVVVVAVVGWGGLLLVYCVRMQNFEGDSGKPRHENRRYKKL